MAIAFIAFGSNLGDRQNNIEEAKKLLEEQAIKILQSSKSIETDPVGGPPGQKKYLNGVIKVQTNLEPTQLLHTLLSIEDKLGRVRLEKDGPRTIDLDILLYDKQKIQTPELVIPHPRMFDRAFVLTPLSEIEPNWKSLISQ
jgi:2-amino-4-hydroxy-6-hydroxymethyldihydropteridine diphosphokinase